MEEKIDKLVSEVEKLRSAVEIKKETVLSRILHVLEKLVIPIMLGTLAWFSSQAGTKILESQLLIEESAAVDRRREFRHSMQIRYIEAEC